MRDRVPFEDPIVAVEDRAGTVMTNRPDKLNVVRQRTFGVLSQTIRDLEADAEVRMVVLTAVGEHSAPSAHRWIDAYLLDSRGVTEKEKLLKALDTQGMRAFLDAADTPDGGL